METENRLYNKGGIMCNTKRAARRIHYAHVQEANSAWKLSLSLALHSNQGIYHTEAESGIRPYEGPV